MMALRLRLNLAASGLYRSWLHEGEGFAQAQLCGNNTNTLSVKSLTPAATMSLLSALTSAIAAIDSSCSSGYSRVSIAINTGCCNSSLCKRIEIDGEVDAASTTPQTHLVMPIRSVARCSYTARTTSYVGLVRCASVIVQSSSESDACTSCVLSIGNEYCAILSNYVYSSKLTGDRCDGR